MSSKDDRDLSLPSSVSGDLVKLSGLDAFWRHRKVSDQAVTGMSVLPSATWKTDSGSGFLMFLFREGLNEDVPIKGDAQVIAAQTGEQSVAASAGYLLERTFEEYLDNKRDPWTVEILESSDEKAAFSKWKQIAFFEIPRDFRKEGEISSN